MGRRKTFDEHQVLHSATQLFWRQGYRSATYQSLEQDTGVSARSLIHCFGDKDQLFGQVLAHYVDQVDTQLQALGPPSAATLLGFFDQLAASPPQNPRNGGCLMANTLAEGSAHTEAAQAELARFSQLFEDFFRDCLKAAAIKGRKRKVALLMGLLWGSSAQIRQQGSVAALAPIQLALAELLPLWQQH